MTGSWKRRGPLTILTAGVLSAAMLLAGCGQIPDSPLGASEQRGAAPEKSAEAEPSKAAPLDCEYTETGTATRPVDPPPSTGVPMKGTATAVIKMSAGTITVTLDRTRSPCTVNSFVSLAEQHFYDATSCPRMTDAGTLFMLQCGDPSKRGDRSGGPGYSFPDELSGDESYGEGTVAMANSGPNSNGSQFFLVYRNSQLDPNYTVFGTMDAAGIAVLNKIAKGGVDNSNGAHDGKPKSEAKIISVTVS
ncbi:peptidylprolyl isomerase [Microlunatus soli]|uniref:Peptidyl-prolyl cis-trans isomerase n=1 Tax=Microlunatus soli TaxID=630515 RepID=A0A1H1ZWN2_9ACTN|nr:peptidylprolyl isomerase [Microlunatus soli]SDT37967.1 peptidyl-prolyl cis-trans isomerase B (cyclophilin B) [Microlunatus soli]